MKFDISDFFRKTVEKIQTSLISDMKTNGYFTRRLMHIYDNISLKHSDNEKRFRQKVVEKAKYTFYYFNLYNVNKSEFYSGRN